VIKYQKWTFGSEEGDKIRTDCRHPVHPKIECRDPIFVTYRCGHLQYKTHALRFSDYRMSISAMSKI